MLRRLNVTSPHSKSHDEIQLKFINKIFEKRFPDRVEEESVELENVQNKKLEKVFLRRKKRPQLTRWIE